MKTEVIAIADEILKGMVINSNSTFISACLGKMGLKVDRHTVFPDDFSILKQAFTDALHRSDLVICTGGLGPTLDDLTRSVAAELFSSPFIFNEEIAADLLSRYGPSLASLQDQATVPEKAVILQNCIGTAPGFLFEEKGKMLALLPGVPLEMEAMLQDALIPILRKKLPDQISYHSEKLYFCHLKETALDPTLRLIQKQYPSMDLGIYPGYGTLLVALRSLNPLDLSAAKEEITAAFPSYVFTSSSGRIEDALIDLLASDKKTVCFAESCTGGLLSHKIASIPGASDVLLGSFVTYSNRLKQDILKVSSGSINQHGSVSAEVVQEMLEGALSLSGADYAIAVSGIAGPSGGTKDKPVGTIWAGIGEKGARAQIFKLNLRGNRQIIMLTTATELLGALYRKIRYGIDPSKGF